MSKYKWYKIGNKTTINIKFYLLPIFHKIYLHNHDAVESFIYNVKYIYAKTPSEAIRKYEKFHKFNILEFANKCELTNNDVIDILDILSYCSLDKESNKLYSIRNSFKSIFAKSTIISDEVIVLDNDVTLTPNALMSKCSVNDYMFYMRQTLKKDGIIKFGMEMNNK